MATFWNRRRKRQKKEIREIRAKRKQEYNERLIKGKMIRDIRTLFEQEEDYYKPKRLGGFSNNNHIEYKRNGDKNNNLSPDECLDKMKPYLMNMITNLQNSDTLEIQLTIAINFISSKDAEKEFAMHSNNAI